jgi:hypothetical protein
MIRPGRFATLTEGTELSLSMSIAGMHAVAHDFERSESGSAGIGMQLGISVGIFVAAQKNTFTGKVGVGFEHTLKGPSVAASRAASQAHDMTFTFDVAISTSTDPYIAGQPSDVIVGGGANLRVLTAIEVDITRDAEDTCVKTPARNAIRRHARAGRRVEWGRGSRTQRPA